MPHHDHQPPAQSGQSPQSMSAPLDGRPSDASIVVAPLTSTGAPELTSSAPGTQQPLFAWTIPTGRTAVDQILAAMLAGQLSLGGERIANVDIMEETAERLLVTLQLTSGRSRLMSFAVYAPPTPPPTLPTMGMAGVAPADGVLRTANVLSANAMPLSLIHI